MGRRLWLVVLLLLSVVVVIPPAAAAQLPAIQVLEQSVESHFHDDLTFRLRVRSAGGQITRAELYLKEGLGSITQMLPAERFDPAPEVEVTAIWKTADWTVPPFVEITYYWYIADSAGQSIQTEPAWVEYSDATHDWQRLEDEHVIVFWYDRPADFAQAIFVAAQEAYAHVARLTGATTERPVRVVIYNTWEDFCYYHAPLSCQEWVGGQSFADMGVTVQWGDDLDWFTYDVIPHELAHLFYGQIFRHTYVRIPEWFSEGLAVYNERTDHAATMALVRAVARRGELVPLADMDGRHTRLFADTMHEWYAQAYSFIAFLVDQYGEETLGELIRAVAHNTRFEKALIQTTGLDLPQFEQRYREWLGYPLQTPPSGTVPPTSRPAVPTRAPAPTALVSPQPTATWRMPPAASSLGPWLLLGAVVGLIVISLVGLGLGIWGVLRSRRPQ